MHRNSKIVFFLSVIVVGRVMLDLSSCTNEDQILSEFVPGGPAFSDTELVSVFTDTSPNVDGIAEASWENTIPLKTRATVPEQLGPDNVPANFLWIWR